MECEYEECTRCAREFEELYALGPYNGNTNTDFYCHDCYEVVHGRPLEITTVNMSKGES